MATILNLPSWIWLLHCGIQTPWFLLSDSLKNILLPLWLCLKLIQSDLNSFILNQHDDGSHLEFCHLEFPHHGISHHSFSSQTHSYFQDWFPPFAQKKLHSHFPPQHLHTKPSYIHSDSTWWWQPFWILPCWIQTLSSWIQTPCYLHSVSPKNTLPPVWLWLKLIQSESNLFILTQLDDGSHLEFCHFQFGHCVISYLSFSSQTHSHFPRLVPTICTLKNLHSFILTELDGGSHLEFCHLGFRHLVIISQFHSKTLSLHSDSDIN